MENKLFQAVNGMNGVEVASIFFQLKNYEDSIFTVVLFFFFFYISYIVR